MNYFIQGNDITDINHIGNINPFRYRGYYYDVETSLYYLNSRYYNPTWGRFINADGIIGANQDMLAYNLYAYCSNNPINMSDPSGESIWNDWASGMKIIGKSLFVYVEKTEKKVISKTKKIINGVDNLAKNMKKSFVVEGGCGQGFGASVQFVKFTYYQDVTYGIKDNQKYSNITGNISSSIFGIGPSWAYEHPYPFPKDFTYLESDKFNPSNIIKSKYLINNDLTFGDSNVSLGKNEMFIGVNADLHIGYGCHFKIGWDIK